jgi:hypothetical protein
MPRLATAPGLAFALACVLAGAAGAQDQVFRYDLTGTDLDGKPYRGTAELRLGAGTCRIVWRTPDPLEGLCMIEGRQLVAYYEIDADRGLALYAADDRGVLAGVWTVSGREARGSEVLTPAGTAAAAAPPPPAAADLEAEGRALVARFLDPAADRAALTAALRPRPEDVRAVYAEPLASALIAALDGLYASGAAIGPAAGQDDVLFTLTTTGALRGRQPVLGEFPGGYEQVLDHFVADVPIARFKFVRRGETLGMAFDGLIHVNGRWVLIPKPWSAL